MVGQRSLLPAPGASTAYLVCHLVDGEPQAEVLGEDSLRGMLGVSFGDTLAGDPTSALKYTIHEAMGDASTVDKALGEVHTAPGSTALSRGSSGRTDPGHTYALLIKSLEADEDGLAAAAEATRLLSTFASQPQGKAAAAESNMLRPTAISLDQAADRDPISTPRAQPRGGRSSSRRPSLLPDDLLDFADSPDDDFTPVRVPKPLSSRPSFVQMQGVHSEKLRTRIDEQLTRSGIELPALLSAVDDEPGPPPSRPAFLAPSGMATPYTSRQGSTRTSMVDDRQSPVRASLRLGSNVTSVHEQHQRPSPMLVNASSGRGSLRPRAVK